MSEIKIKTELSDREKAIIEIANKFISTFYKKGKRKTERRCKKGRCSSRLVQGFDIRHNALCLPIFRQNY